MRLFARRPPLSPGLLPPAGEADRHSLPRPPPRPSLAWGKRRGFSGVVCDAKPTGDILTSPLLSKPRGAGIGTLRFRMRKLRLREGERGSSQA